MIAPEWRDRLRRFLGGIVRQMEGSPESVGGVSDHVHLLVGLSATHRLCDVMREIKSASSRWVHEEIGQRQFRWQEGYGAFTVSACNRSKVRMCIEEQERHHQKRTFQEEYIEFLRKGGVEHDDRYLW